MKVSITLSSSHNEATVVLRHNWLERLLGCVDREFMALRSPSLRGGNAWWDDSRRAPVRGSRVIAELDYAYWKADREVTQAAVRQTFRNRLDVQRRRAELGLDS